MKYLFSLLFICSSYFSFSQITVGEMMKVYNMNTDQFESFALSKGFSFYKLKNDEMFTSHSYTKGTRENTKYLELYTKWIERGKTVIYQTANSSEFLNIKNQLKIFGFTLQLEDTFEGAPYKEYRNNKFEIHLFTSEEGDYEICLFKY